MDLPESTFSARRKQADSENKHLNSFFRFTEIYFLSWEINFNMAGERNFFFSQHISTFLIRESPKLLIKLRAASPPR